MNRETGSDCAFSELLVGAKCIGSRGSMPDRARGAYIVLPILPSWWEWKTLPRVPSSPRLIPGYSDAYCSFFALYCSTTDSANDAASHL